MGWHKIVGHNDPTDFTAGVVFERDSNGEPTKYANKGEPADLTADQVKYLETLGFKVESSSKAEADEFAQRGSLAGDDIAGSGPILGDNSSNPAPGDNAEGNDQGGKSARKS